MTKEQEVKEILNKFKNNETQRDKLERGRDGGWKIGDIYKHLELNPAIETVLSMIEKRDKQIDLMALAILNYDDQLVINRYKNIDEVKETFKDLAKEKGE